MDNIEAAFDSFEIKSETMSKAMEECSELGIEIVKNKEKEFDRKITTKLQESVRDMAVIKKLVPEVYKESRFDKERIVQKLSENKSNKAYKIINFDKYINTCLEVLTSLRIGKLPARNMLIGAPKGFCKTIFANECIMTMEEKQMKAVPYISLFELAEIKNYEERRLMNPYGTRQTKNEDGNYTFVNYNNVEYTKKPEIITGSYSWSEYMNCDCLFCHFTDISSKQLESRTLYQILAIRGAKGLPTVVMIATSLKPYVNDNSLREYIWDEILEANADYTGYDRIVHTSCFKARKDSIMDYGENINSAGIVEG